jgi:hypothetical protein
MHDDDESLEPGLKRSMRLRRSTAAAGAGSNIKLKSLGGKWHIPLMMPLISSQVRDLKQRV